MKNLENCRIIYLSSKIEERERIDIVYTYFGYKSDILTKDRKNLVDEKVNKILEREYKKLLGNNWRDVYKKYKTDESPCFLVSEQSPYNNIVWKGLDYVGLAIPEDFPAIGNKENPKDYFWNPLKNLPKECREITSLLFDISDIKYGVYKELLSKKIIFDTKIGFWDYTRYCFLPGISTFKNLRDKFPEIFDAYIQDQLKKYDQIKVIEIEDEIKYLRNKLC